MLNWILSILGWLSLVSSSFGIAIKLFGSDDAVAAYAGGSRNLDAGILLFAIGLIFLALCKALDELESQSDYLRQIGDHLNDQDSKGKKK